MAVQVIERVPKGEISHSGRQWTHPTWGATWDTYDPEAVDLTVYDKMRRTDETIKAGLQFVKLSVVSKLGQFKHPDEDITDFVNTAMRLMKGTVEGVVSDLLSALWAGFAVAELVYGQIPLGKWKGGVYYEKIKVLHPLSIYPKGIHHDGKGNVEKIVQSEGQVGEATLEKGKFVHFAYDGAGGTFGSPYGLSGLRSIHRWWFMKDLVMKLWGMYMEKFAVPLVVGFAPPGTVQCPVDGNKEDYSLALLHILQSWNTKTEIVLPVIFDANGQVVKDVPRLDVISPQASTGEVFESFVRQADTAELLGLLVPALTLSEARFGTRAQSQTHLEAFFAMLDELLRLVCDLLVEQVVRPLLELNFANLDDFGQWVSQPLTEEDKEKSAKNLYQMFQAGAMEATEPRTQAWVRGQFAPELQEQIAAEEAG